MSIYYSCCLLTLFFFFFFGTLLLGLWHRAYWNENSRVYPRWNSWSKGYSTNWFGGGLCVTESELKWNLFPVCCSASLYQLVLESYLEVLLVYDLRYFKIGKASILLYLSSCSFLCVLHLHAYFVSMPYLLIIALINRNISCFRITFYWMNPLATNLPSLRF